MEKFYSRCLVHASISRKNVSTPPPLGSGSPLPTLWNLNRNLHGRGKKILYIKGRTPQECSLGPKEPGQLHDCHANREDAVPVSNNYCGKDECNFLSVSFSF